MSSAKALSPGSLVLVTGINGYVGGHVADLLLSKGFRVRGTARDQAKLDIATKAFEKYPGQFEGIVIEDITTHDAFAHIVKGTDGVVHVASDISFGSDPNVVVTKTVDAIKNVLAAANDEPQVKRFVYTSSNIALIGMDVAPGTQINDKSWNKSDVEAAWAPPPYNQDRAVAVYAASKVQAEEAAWEFVKESKPHFTLNSVLPGFVIGPAAFPKQNLSTSGWVQGLHDGDEGSTQQMLNFPAIWTTDARDVARLHVAALTEEDIVSRRLISVADATNYSIFVAALKKADPKKTDYPAGPEGQEIAQGVYDVAYGEKILQRLGRPGFTHLEETLRDQLAVAAAQ